MTQKSDTQEGEKLIAKNRRALHDFAITERIEAGLSLTGSEVKSCRAAKVSLSDSYVVVERGEAMLVHCHIAEYEAANRFNHVPLRPRKLLLHRKEIDALEVKLNHQGQVAVPLSCYFKNGRVKVELGVGKGKSNIDRRESVKEREAKREIARALGRGAR